MAIESEKFNFKKSGMIISWIWPSLRTISLFTHELWNKNGYCADVSFEWQHGHAEYFEIKYILHVLQYFLKIVDFEFPDLLLES